MKKIINLKVHQVSDEIMNIIFNNCIIIFFIICRYIVLGASAMTEDQKFYLKKIMQNSRYFDKSVFF